MCVLGLDIHLQKLLIKKTGWLSVNNWQQLSSFSSCVRKRETLLEIEEMGWSRYSSTLSQLTIYINFMISNRLSLSLRARE